MQLYMYGYVDREHLLLYGYLVKDLFPYKDNITGKVGGKIKHTKTQTWQINYKRGSDENET